jgi:hypothetical protein
MLVSSGVLEMKDRAEKPHGLAKPLVSPEMGFGRRSQLGWSRSHVLCSFSDMRILEIRK